MAYVSSTAPIPQNGMLPPPAACVDASNAAVEMARRVSVAGRMVAYGTVPTLDSLRSVSSGVADSAAIVLPQSELARRSILSGAVPAVSANNTVTVRNMRPAPVVVPLSYAGGRVSSAACVPNLPKQSAALSNVQQSPTMPAALPAPSSAAGGVSGYSPRWGDALVAPASSAAGSSAGAGVLEFVRRNPWLVFGALGALIVFDANRRGAVR